MFHLDTAGSLVVSWDFCLGELIFFTRLFLCFPSWLPQVNNLRSKVSRYAINTLGELFRTMKKHVDHEVDEVARVLLQKMGDTSEFIQKAASRSLGIMVGSVTPARAMTALMASGVQYVVLLLVVSITLNCVGWRKGQEGEGEWWEERVLSPPSSVNLVIRLSDQPCSLPLVISLCPTAAYLFSQSVNAA